MRHSTQPVISAQVLQLNLPTLSKHPSRENGKDQFDEQSYQAFAEKAQKKNVNVAISRQTMDDAFRFAASRMPGSSNSKAFEQMIARCLGRESEKYWKGR
ncbi:hypothetical protein LTR36_002392 [Oleoguttula mirabilis]|uniref:Uncharacterized protein n=1 Tax=Oleoguttula mirabilis TaxID=1507867 RepID=A0AAV9JLP3_9PEZI|nr:hypothetical protein LTR36_002392 [Oleoguttula mirabilis]